MYSGSCYHLQGRLVILAINTITGISKRWRFIVSNVSVSTFGGIVRFYVINVSVCKYFVTLLDCQIFSSACYLPKVCIYASVTLDYFGSMDIFSTFSTTVCLIIWMLETWLLHVRGRRYPRLSSGALTTHQRNTTLLETIFWWRKTGIGL